MEPVAIIGYGCVYPNQINTTQKFWKMVLNGDIIADSLNNVMLHFDTYPGTIFKNGVKIILYTILPVGIANYMPLDMIISFNVKNFLIVIVFTILIPIRIIDKTS